MGLRRFATWRVSAAHALAVMLFMTGTAHFMPASVTVMPNAQDLAAMVPDFVPFPLFMVYLTGVLELAGAVGLILARTRWAAGICLAILFVVMLPANIYAVVENIPLAGDPATPLWIRVPEQLVYIAVALWGARSAPRPALFARGAQPTAGRSQAG